MADKERIDKLKLLLKDLFQFENNDLDFGIYRIINIKKKEISEFIDKELFEIIKEKIKTVEDNTDLQKSLDVLKKDIETNFGCDISEAKKKYAETPKVKEYIEQEKELKLADKENDIEEEIYDDIINFFSRYYDKGDFISKRRYSKDSKYAIPYNGEEVYLYWANNDQYYVKTGESFKNYTFKTGSLLVDFEIVSEDVEVEKGNIKDAEKKFFIFNDVNYDERKKHLIVKFGYRGLTEEEEKAIEKLSEKKRVGKDEVNTHNLKQINEKIGIWGLSDLQNKHTKIDGEKSESSELDWHLNKYTTKNSSDYFIHKDLKKFLSQELDFYIKNELLHIDDVDSRDDLKINLNRIKVFKQISAKIVNFLSQVEEFQKRLWEKKKFVIATDYCITLDYVDEKYYPEILKNKEQLEEWKKLYSFDVDAEVKKLNGKLTGAGKKEEEQKTHLLKANPTLVIDTKLLAIDFKYQILSEIDDLDEKITGILINSDNFQALNLLLNKYKEKIKCCYIDPPYNTSASEILYKNNYKHSAWLSLMKNRLDLAHDLLEEDGIISIAIDDEEVTPLRLILEGIFSKQIGVSCIRSNPVGRKTSGRFTPIHEYALFFGKSEKSIPLSLPKDEEKNNRYPYTDTKGRYTWLSFIRTGNNDLREDSPRMYYPIAVDENNGLRIPKMEWQNSKLGYKILEKIKEKETIVFPIKKEGQIIIEKNWQRGYERFQTELDEYRVRRIDGEIKIDFKARMDENALPTTWWDQKKYASSNYGAVEMKNLFGNMPFSYPKSCELVKDCALTSGLKQNSTMLIDFFAGSGTTGHAVLKINKDDKGQRKFILVEMGKYFDTVTKPRIQKVIYSDNWKDGTPQDNNGSKKQIIKCQSLEQYEDSLNNIFFREPSTLAKESKDYKIKYMLEFESKGSNVLLNIDALDNPFEYKLRVETNNEFKETDIDLVETFNYIAGINVKSIKKLQDKKVTYIIVKGLRGEKDVVVIWRNKSDGFDPKRDKDFVTKEILKEEFDEILVNGNSLIDGAKSIDEVFKANMFRG